jgi:DNA-directed RNA polymerase specialized sigma24 family protein
LVNERYQEQAIEPTNPRLWIPEINLGLGLTACTVRKIEGSWLRWCDQEGNFYPTPAESYQAETEVAKAETEAAKAETEAAKVETEAAKVETEAAKVETEAAKAEIEAVKAQMEQQQQQSILSFLGLGLSSEQISIALGVEISKVEAIRNR